MTTPDIPADPARDLHRSAQQLARLFDAQGRIARWPKRRKQLLLLDYIAAHIEPGPAHDRARGQPVHRRPTHVRRRGADPSRTD
jgi:hypothetical protein